MVETNNVFLSDDTLRPLRNHIVGLAVTDVLREPHGSSDDVAKDFGLQTFCISTFAIEIPVDSKYTAWFLITAGHIIQDIITRLKYNRKILKCRLLDGTPGKTGAIPFVFDVKEITYIDEDGYDFGLIPLREIYVRALRKGGVMALNENNWSNIPKSIDEYYVIGFPTKAQIIKNTSKSVSVDLGVPLIPINPISTPPKEFKQSIKRFYAKIPIVTDNIRGRNITLDDINGLSGGPIFAVKRINQNNIFYWIIGVQSSWIPKYRIIAACFIKPLIDYLCTIVNQKSDILKYPGQ